VVSRDLTHGSSLFYCLFFLQVFKYHNCIVCQVHFYPPSICLLYYSLCSICLVLSLSWASSHIKLAAAFIHCLRYFFTLWLNTITHYIIIDPLHQAFQTQFLLINCAFLSYHVYDNLLSKLTDIEFVFHPFTNSFIKPVYMYANK